MAEAKQAEAEYFLPDEFLSDDFFTEGDEENPKASVVGAPPQSTPRGIGNWSFSSNGSPTGPPQEPSPLSTPFARPGEEALDLLYALERLNLNNENPSKNRNSLGCFYPNQELIKQQLQAARFYHLKRQQLMKMQQEHASAVWGRQRQPRAPAVANPVNPLCLSPSEWPPLQKQQNQQPANGMTAVFLNGGGRRQSNGTGVFLPRRIGAPTEPKKQNCSTVLLPARVVQALNLNVEEMGVRRPRMSGCHAVDSNHALMGQSNLKRNHRLHNHQAAVLGLGPEICLPQEWTY